MPVQCEVDIDSCIHRDGFIIQKIWPVDPFLYSVHGSLLQRGRAAKDVQILNVSVLADSRLQNHDSCYSAIHCEERIIRLNHLDEPSYHHTANDANYNSLWSSIGGWEKDRFINGSYLFDAVELSSKIGLAGCPIHPRSLRMGGNHEPESAALVQSSTGFRRPAGDETGALASIRQLAKGQPIARAVGAKVISPALQRWVSAPNLQPESRTGRREIRPKCRSPHPSAIIAKRWKPRTRIGRWPGHKITKSRCAPFIHSFIVDEWETTTLNPLSFYDL